MADPQPPDDEPEYLRVARSQLDSLDDHCETARAALTDLERRLDAGEGRTALRAATTEEPTLAETCRSIRTNTFDPLHRQLSKLVVATPESAGDLSVDRLDEAVTELYEHHDRLMGAVDDLADLTGDGEYEEDAVRDRVERAVQAADHLQSTAALVRCLLAKSVPATFAASVDEAESETRNAGAGFAVTGTVTHGERPLSGVTVRALDVDLRAVETLGEATTDASGEYRITYQSSAFEEGDRGSADVVVHVFNEVGERVGESSLQYNVGREAQVDVTIPPDTTVEPTEYARLRSELEPLLDGDSLTSVPGGSLTFLARELSLDERSEYPAGAVSVGRLRDAAEIAPRSPFTEQALYGIARQRDGLADRSELVEADAAGLAEDLRAADEAGVVDVEESGLSARLERGLAALREAVEMASKHESRTRVRVLSNDRRPLTNTDVRVSDPSGGQRTVSTDDAGEADLAFMTDETGDAREFDLTVLNDAGAPVHGETVSMTDGELREVSVDSPATGSSGAASVESVVAGDAPGVSEQSLPITGDVSDETLDVVRAVDVGDAGSGADGTVTPGAPVGPDGAGHDPGISGAASPSDVVDVTGDGTDGADVTGTVGPSSTGGADRASVGSLSTLELTMDPVSSATLATRGYTNQVAIATTPPGAFRQSVNADFDTAVANLVHSRAMAQTYYLDGQMVQRRTALANGHVSWRPSTDDESASRDTGGTNGGDS